MLDKLLHTNNNIKWNLSEISEYYDNELTKKMEWYFLCEDNNTSNKITITKELLKDIAISSEILDSLSKQYYFNTFIHMSDFLNTIPENKVWDIDYLLSALNNIEQNSLTDINKNKSGNCVDFALKAKNEMLKKRIIVDIIWTIPDSEDYNTKQKDFMKIRHTSLIFEKDWNRIMFEPWRKCPHPIILNKWYITWNDERRFKTISENNETLLQETIMPKNRNKKNLREFSLNKISIEECQQLTKKLTRIPRRLDLLNNALHDTTHFLSFKPNNNWKLLTNVPWVNPIFFPNQLTNKENILLSEEFNIPDIKQYLSSLFSKYFAINEKFRVK